MAQAYRPSNERDNLKKHARYTGRLKSRHWFLLSLAGSHCRCSAVPAIRCANAETQQKESTRSLWVHLSLQAHRSVDTGREEANKPEPSAEFARRVKSLIPYLRTHAFTKQSGIIPEGHVRVLRPDAELLEQADHVGVVPLVKYHKPSSTTKTVHHEHMCVPDRRDHLDTKRLPAPKSTRMYVWDR